MPDYTKWTRDELVALRAMLRDDPTTETAVDDEMLRRERASKEERNKRRGGYAVFAVLAAFIIVGGGYAVTTSTSPTAAERAAKIREAAASWCGTKVDAPTTLEGQIILAANYVALEFHVNEYDRDNSEQRTAFLACMDAMPQVAP